MNKILKNNLTEHFELLNYHQNEFLKKIPLFSDILIQAIKNKNKILIIGNGGSAADAQHFATELTVRLKYNRVALPAIALTTDTSALTAIGNDFSFEEIFSRQVEALGKRGDILIGITTSGKSKNITKALKLAKLKKIKTIGILGGNGGTSKKYCDFNIVIKSSSPSRVQELHIIFWQNICELVENNFKNKK